MAVSPRAAVDHASRVCRMARPAGVAAAIASRHLPFPLELPVPSSAVAPLAPVGRLFAAAAFFEGLTWAGLLLGMLLKYGTQTTELGVWLFGRLHGVAFLVYLVASVVAAVRLRWPWWAWLLSLLAALPPLVTVPLEMWFRRIGLLGAPPRRATR
jgi:integral membrane protein